MKRAITAEEFDRKFDAGEDVSEYLDFDNAIKVDGRSDVRRINVDMPEWMIVELDKEAKRLAVPRQAVIKRFVDDGLAHRNV